MIFSSRLRTGPCTHPGTLTFALFLATLPTTAKSQSAPPSPLKLHTSASAAFSPSLTGAEGYSATNGGLAAEAGLTYSRPLSIPGTAITLGSHAFGALLRTASVQDNADYVKDFWISPWGIAGELGFRWNNLFIRAGAGWYRAEARIVQGGVGYSYELNSGFGFHTSADFTLPLTFVSPSLEMLAGITYRRLQFAQRTHISSDTTTNLDPPWTQHLLTLGGGVAWHL